MIGKIGRRIRSGWGKLKDWVWEQIGWKKYVAGLVATVFVGLVPATWFLPPVGVVYTAAFLTVLYLLGEAE